MNEGKVTTTAQSSTNAYNISKKKTSRKKFATRKKIISKGRKR